VSDPRIRPVDLYTPLSRRSLLAGSTAGAALLLGGRRQPSYASQGPAGEISVLYWTDRNDHFLEVIDAFTAETGIGVNYEALPEDYITGQQLVTTRLAAGDVEPDCIFCDDIETALYGTAGWLEPLDPIVEEMGIDRDDIPQTLLTDVSSWDGVLYRLPWTSDTELLFYRTDYFEEAGVELPTDWPDFVETAKALSTGDDRFGIALSGQKNGVLGNDIQHWANQAGGGVTKLDQPGSREAIVFYKELFATHKVAPPSTPEEDYNTVLQGFLDGRYAMWWVWDGFLGAMRSDPEFWQDQVAIMSPMLHGPVNAQTSVGAWGWTMNAFSAKKDLARQWIEFTARPDVVRMLLIRGQAPARLSLLNDAEFQEELPQTRYIAELAAADGLKARPITPGFQEIYDAVEQNVHAYLTDQIDIDTAITQAMDKIQPILEREAQ
jgi:multiple sugar transport system substrate-binding protein